MRMPNVGEINSIEKVTTITKNSSYTISKLHVKDDQVYVVVQDSQAVSPFPTEGRVHYPEQL